MNTATECQVIPFPDVRRWAAIAEKYVDYMLSGDPRAAFYYLEFELKFLDLAQAAPALKSQIAREYRKRGFSRPPEFHRDS